MKVIDKASVIQNGLSREECEAMFALIAAAEAWRDTMVYSNAPAGGYPEGDNGRAHWAKVNNHNGKLVQAVDSVLDVIGSAR